ncbi:MAG: four helix bundle protein [Bacteroidetes bacterium]|nr:four helix bundle protein [Bacteroidota bacterium]
MKENIIQTKSYDFALKIVKLHRFLVENKKEFVLSKQLLRSGTSIGANVREAQSAESIKDFIHKMKIAHKEAYEVEYWLLLCKESKYYPFEEKLLKEAEELLKIIGKIIHTSKQNIKRN